MCGICGIFEHGRQSEADAEQVVRMTHTLVHRGPDEEGFFNRPFCCMGMRRLSIIDLAESHQPISNETGDVSIVFNGEIYNFPELREELIRAGHRFQTHGDTEVIVHLYEEHGAACVEHLDGMFAFAIFDERPQAGPDGCLFIARDRFGKKPLYYADTGSTLVFGSELKPILVDRRIRRDLDFEAIHHYLTMLMVPAPLSVFSAIRKLPGGHYLECDRKGVRIRRYWQYPLQSESAAASEKVLVRDIRELLFEAVRKRLISEVPLGAFLSGGLDSSAVVAIMSRITGRRVETFSIGFEGPSRNNELPYAREVAEHYHTHHHEFLAKPDIIETIHEVVRFADEPFAISSAIPLLLISKAAHKYVKVVLTGDGGDELFGGYEGYLYERWAESYRRLPTLADRGLNSLARTLPADLQQPAGRWRNRILRFVANARTELSERRLGWGSAFSEAEKRALYRRGFNPNGAPRSTADFVSQVAAVSEGKEPAARQNDLDIRIWLPDEMLAKVDRMTMGASIEARCPLLDWKLTEYTAKLPFRVKMPGDNQASLKYLLRKAVSDLIPAKLMNRPKQGFNVPLDAWFRGKSRSFLLSALQPDRLSRFGVFDPSAVSALIEKHDYGHIKASSRLYALLVFQIWAEAYL